MMYKWKPGMIEFMKDAAEYNAFHDVLAERVADYLPLGSTLCDAGCGMGYLSLALSKTCSQVTAIDISEKPLKAFESNLSRLKKNNIKILKGDLFEQDPEKLYDAMVFCFFGGTMEALKVARKQCQGTVILIKRNWEKRRFTLTEKHLERHTFEKTKAQLRSMGISFKEEVIPLEMGQPFRSVEAAVDFFKLYASDTRNDSVNSMEVQKKLITITSDTYSHYLPMHREVGMIVIQTADIPTF